jgi:hypothetical protein
LAKIPVRGLGKNEIINIYREEGRKKGRKECRKEGRKEGRVVYKSKTSIPRVSNLS